MAYFGRAAVLLLMGMANSPKLDTLPRILSVSFWLQALSVPAGLLTIYVVHQLPERQYEKHARLEILRAGSPTAAAG
jgi:hypothetical protein